ncbi:MAG: hypothetical protein COB76_04400 [Alphaproteobacteria bacterium]|nr:MAG: hypothetical protein COB76_04400 [Alphaproteobacteria bacterium]
MPQFSIITITKNNPDGFKKTKQSVESQNYNDFEWVVVDGDIEPDNGLYDAMNKGIDRAVGDYLIFMNAGDVFAAKDTLKTISRYCPADFMYGDAMEGGFIKCARHHSKIARGLITHHQAMVYARNIIGDRRYDERYPIAADYKFTAEHLVKSKVCTYINKPLCIFETGGVSGRNASQGRAEQVDIRRELGMWAPLTPCRQWTGQILKTHAPRLYLKLRVIFDK